MSTLRDVMYLEGVYKTIPPWLPTPEVTPLSVKHKGYQEVYSRALEVYYSREYIHKIMGEYQEELTQIKLGEFNGGQIPHVSHVNLDRVVQLDRYSQLVLGARDDLDIEQWRDTM